MNEQSISNFYTPNISTAVKIVKKNLDEPLPNIDQEMMEDNESYLMLDSGITDFWTINNSYKKLIESSEIAGKNNKELQKSLGAKLESLYNSKFGYKTPIDDIMNVEHNSNLNEVKSNDIEAQVVLLWRCKHYWSKSIAAKMDLSKIAVNKILAKYKLFVKSGRVKNLMTRRWVNQAITDDQIEKIKKYIESIDSTPLKISMIKNAVWPTDSGIKPPCNSTISKVLKKKLKMSYKILHKWNTKRRDLQNQRLFIESLYLQTQLKEIDIEAIYIDEFKFSSRK